MQIEADAILFDLDGVLANSNAAVEHAWRTWAGEKGLEPEEILAWSHGRRTTETLERFIPGIPQAPEVARLVSLEREARHLVVDVPGAREFVASLNGVPWAVATSGETEIAEPRLRKVGLPVPRVLVTGEKVRRGKPDPEVYLKAADALGVDPSRCVVFEDAPPGVEAGRGAGARVVALLTTFPAAALAAADALIDDFRCVRAERTALGVRLHIVDRNN
jgi:mannitol-1-/sugar-/sorbitol-6-phosphatase